MDISDLVSVKLIKISKDDVIFDKNAQSWCKLPYPNHPNGCPNYGKRPNCPPNSPYMEYITKKYDNFYLLYAEFDIGEYAKRMKRLHPHWTDRQCRNLLYWQNQLKRILKDEYRVIKKRVKGINILSSGSGWGNDVYSMEAVGINVILMLKKLGIEYELKPKRKVVLACLVYGNERIPMEKGKGSQKTLGDF